MQVPCVWLLTFDKEFLHVLIMQAFNGLILVVQETRVVYVCEVMDTHFISSHMKQLLHPLRDLHVHKK